MLLKLASRNLLRNSRRTLAVALTVAMGTGSLFVFAGFNDGIMNQYRDNTIRSRFGYGQVSTRGYREKVHEKPWEHWIDDPDTLLEKLSQTPGVTQVFPRLEFPALLTNGRINVSGKGQGIDGSEEATFFDTLNIEEGVTLSTQENGILLGRGLARALNVKPGDAVTVLGNTIDGSFNGMELVVTGIFHTGSKDFDDVVFRVPLERAQWLLNTEKVESVALGLTGLEAWPSVENVVQNEFSNLEAIPFAVLDKVYYQHAVDWLGAQFGVIKLIILAVVLLGIFSTVSQSVLERKQEVGNLRANGDSAKEVMKLFSTEGLLLGVVGALVGLLAVFALVNTVLADGILMPPSPGITRQFHVRVELSWWAALTTFFMGSFCCLLATSLAALKVTRLSIAEAMRST